MNPLGRMRLPFGRINNIYPQWVSNEPVSVTGTTDRTTLARVQLPGGMLGPNGQLRIDLLSSIGSTGASGSAKNLKIELGNSDASLETLFDYSVAVSAGLGFCLAVSNRNDVASQVFPSLDVIFPAADIAFSTSSVDTDQDMILRVSCALEDADETFTLERLHVETIFCD